MEITLKDMIAKLRMYEKLFNKAEGKNVATTKYLTLQCIINECRDTADEFERVLENHFLKEGALHEIKKAAGIKEKS